MCHVSNWKSKEQVILNFGAIAMTGSEIEQSFQKVKCAGDITSLFIKYLENNTYPDDSRIFVPPLYKVKKHCFPSKFKNYNRISCT